MKRMFAIVLAATFYTSPTVAAEISAPSLADEAQIDKLIGSFIAGLKSGKAKDAIVSYMATNALTRQKTTDVDFVGLQVETVITTYGPISECQLIEKLSRGSWTQARLYICQHANYLTRWIFTVIKTPQGWQAANFRYDDKFTNTIDQ